jgi:hypothetical protein
VATAVLFEYQVAFVAMILTVYAAVRHRRAALYFLMGAIPPALFLGAYHTALFGRPWEFPFGHIENPQWAVLHNQVRLFGLRLPNPIALGTVLFSIDFGLFIFSPFLLVGLFGAGLLVARGRRAEGSADAAVEGGVILAVTLVMAGFLAGAPTPHPGWCVGPRYIAVVAPFLAAGVARAWRLTGRFVLPFSAITAGLVIPSVVLNVASGAVYPHFPEQFDNPVFDLVFPLLGARYVPYSLGWWLGLPGLWSLAPLALAVALALSAGIAGDDRRAKRWAAHAAAAVLIAIAFLAPLARYGRNSRPAETEAAAFVRATWEPPPR